ncbi:tRNA (guanine(9)-N1)-methyltransferase [Exophiala dermatitidis]
MEAEERPTKLRKLDSHAEPGAQDTGTPDQQLLSGVEVNGAVVSTTNTNTTDDNKPVADEAASNGDVVQEKGNVEREDSETDEHNQNQCQDPEQSQTTSTDPAQQDEQPLSKNQLKKLRKKQEWEAGREYRKLKRKQKMQEKRARKREAREGGEQDSTDGAAVQKPNPRKKPVQLPITILIDCGFDDLMIEKERISLGSQITRSYSDNSRAPFQAHLVISSWGGHLKKRFDTVLNKHYLNWRGVTFLEEDFVEAARRADEIMRGPRGGKLVGVFEKYAAAAAAAPSNRLGNSQRNQQGDQTTPPSAPGKAEAEADPAASVDTKTTEDIAKPPSTSSSSLQDDSHQTSQQESALESAQKDTQPSTDSLTPAPTDLPPQHHHPPIPKGEVVYLTSDSPDTLTELSPYSTYIVGGLVDKNRHKGICYKIARERGIKTAKLPIGEYMEMQSRKVLATNHVVEIMVRWLECGDWGEAFLKVIPKRKGGRLREDHEEHEHEHEPGHERNIDSSVAGDEEREDEDDHDDKDNDNENNNGAAADGVHPGNEATELEPQVENQD